MSTRWLMAALVLLVACGHVPPDRYGIKAVNIKGSHKLDPDALAACLYSRERERVQIGFGLAEPHECGEPPFDEHHGRLKLWSWATADWPIYDRQAFIRDSARIVRWYEARGYHQARVMRTSVQPAQAVDEDLIDSKASEPGCERIDSDEGCQVRLTFVVDEGEPTVVKTLEVDGLAGLPAELSKELRSKLELRKGAPFDEALHDRSKTAIEELLQERGYARVQVSAQVSIDRAQRTASVKLTVVAGPRCKFGQVLVEGASKSMVPAVRAFTSIAPGDPFSLEALKSARAGVFKSGSFGRVSVEPVLTGSGDTIDVQVVVTPVRKHRFGVGVGFQSGIVSRGDTWDPVTVPQWDLHLIAKYTQNQLFDGPRRFTIEDRPAMIIQEPFPDFTVPRFGNELRTELRQMGVIDPRTAAALTNSYIYGPDPYDTFFRHRIDSQITLDRRFLRSERLYLSFGLANSVYRVPAGETTSDGGEPSADYLLTYFFERIRFDYRDDEQRPTRGFMYQTELQQSGMGKASSWRYVRATPDFRVYVPLPWHMTFAVRFALGFYFIQRSDAKLDQLSRDLGPRDLRLRGGGATSNRGFLPGELGDGSDGGTRRWETSGELRLPLTHSFGVVGFMDAGDVSQKPQLRWNVPQTSAGFGLRYYTIVGALRFDMAWRIKNLQVFGPDPRDPGGEQSQVDFGFTKMNGALHLTLGESF